jgi:hypothetical protein
MDSNPGYPALRALFKRAFSGNSMRKSLERLAQVSRDEAPRIAADIRGLLAAVPAERGLRRVVLQELGCGYDPGRDGGTVKGWLQALMRHCESMQLRSRHGVTPETELREALVAEIARIGVAELSIRTMVEPAALLAAARGGELNRAARRALSAYSFGGYPDLDHLLGGYFYQEWDGSGESWQQVVDAFVAEARPGRLRGTAADLDRLLQADDSALDAVLTAIGGLSLPVAPAGHRPWLMELRNRIVAAIPS